MTRTAEGRRRELHGILLLDKPRGLSSNQALQRVRRALGARKAGHTGSLDPLATGMLPLCFGDATRVSQLLLDADKVYTAVAVLGSRTETGDTEGEVTAQAPVPAMDAAGWQAIADRFVGEIEQVPPMYSALKHGGRRLYELARAGETVERPARRVRIDALDVLDARHGRVTVRVRCSKGTYIRTLVEDLAAAADTVAHTGALRRESVAPFEAPMIPLDAIEARAAAGALPEDWLLPVDAGLAGWPVVTLDAAAAGRFCQGQRLPGVPASGCGAYRVYATGGRFLGTAELGDDGVLRPTRVMAAARAAFEAQNP